MGIVTVGLDVGQRVDPTALAVCEAEERDGAIHHVARHVERLALGTPYPQVAERVAQVVNGIVERTGGEWPDLYADATGVGTPLVDMMRKARVEARLVPVYFTHGDRLTRQGGELRLGKAYLVSRMQALLQAKVVHLPQTSEAEALAEELLDYEIQVSEDANDRYGAFKVGSHDDLVTALGLAVLRDPQPPPEFIVVRVGGKTGGKGSGRARLRRRLLSTRGDRLPRPDPSPDRDGFGRKLR